MKTKSIVFALVMGFVSVAAVAADPVSPKMVVLNQKDGGIFKVIYAGIQTGKISLTIYDEANTLVFAETVSGVDGFIRPVNFSGMNEGTRSNVGLFYFTCFFGIVHLLQTRL
jgi:hypothetical protein